MTNDRHTSFVRLAVRIVATLFLLCAAVCVIAVARIEARGYWGMHSHYYHVAFRLPHAGGECASAELLAMDCPDRLRFDVYATRGPGGVCMSLWVWQSVRGAQYNACLRYSDLERLWIAK